MLIGDKQLPVAIPAEPLVLTDLRVMLQRADVHRPGLLVKIARVVTLGGNNRRGDLILREHIYLQYFEQGFPARARLMITM